MRNETEFGLKGSVLDSLNLSANKNLLFEIEPEDISKMISVSWEKLFLAASFLSTLDSNLILQQEQRLLGFKPILESAKLFNELEDKLRNGEEFSSFEAQVIRYSGFAIDEAIRSTSDPVEKRLYIDLLSRRNELLQKTRQRDRDRVERELGKDRLEKLRRYFGDEAWEHLSSL